MIIMRPTTLRFKAITAFVGVSLISLAICLNWLFFRTYGNGLVVDPGKYFPISFLDSSPSQRVDEKNRQFWDSFKPNLKCPRELKSRVGAVGDGGKWTCGLAALGRQSLAEGYNCAVYSFGVSGDSSFEAAVLQTTLCSVYAYDPSVKKIAQPLTPSNPRVHFQPLGIGGKDSGSSRTLKTLMTQNGHKFVDILKVDVEGAEFPIKMFEDFDELPFGQLLIELHTGWIPETSSKEVTITGLLQALEKRGARIFSVEVNERATGCAEFSMINLKYLKLFIP